MKLTDEQKRTILEGFLEILTRISDLEYQKRVWIKGEGPECDDFDETICLYFDIGNPALEDYKELNISESQYGLLKKFHEELRKFSDENDEPKQFISTNAWKKITEKAAEILKAFNFNKITNK